MSSVPVQFLINVLSTPQCSEVPVILPLTGCLEVQVNISINITLYVLNLCNTTTTIITDLIPTVSINGMQISSLINSTTNTSLVYLILTWTPQLNQIGSEQFCALLIRSNYIESFDEIFLYLSSPVKRQSLIYTVLHSLCQILNLV